MKLRAYKNLHSGLWCLYGKGNTKVDLDSCPVDGRSHKGFSGFVMKDVTFVVSTATHKRGQLKRNVDGRPKRSVHAFACGFVTSEPVPAGSRVRVSYNPAGQACFYRVDTGEPVTSAAWVVFNREGCFIVL
jgi:hypothetical protein